MKQHGRTGRRLRNQVATVGVVLGFAVTLVSPLAAQHNTVADPAERRTAMERLSFLVGQWSGDAWAVTGPGSRVELRQTESVRYSLDGQVLLVEGVGRALAEGVVGDTLFHAVATIDWLPDRGYLMRSYVLAGQYGEFAIVPSDEGDGYTWAMDVPGGKVRYKMQLTSDGSFDERGWFITAQGCEVPTFGMLRHRIPGR